MREGERERCVCMYVERERPILISFFCLLVMGMTPITGGIRDF